MSTTDVELLNKHIRKLKKKLRQIDHLKSLARDLSSDELYKVANRYSYKRQIESLESQLVNCSVNVEIEQEIVSAFQDSIQSGSSTVDFCDSSSKPTRKQSEGSSTKQCIADVPCKKTKPSSEQTLCQYMFGITSMDGHNDVIFTCDFREDVLVTGSRDTQIKVWNATTLKEIKSLSGHGGTVTKVVILTPSFITLMDSTMINDKSHTHIISCCFDCTICLWDVTSGRQLHSLYLYTPITAFSLDESLQIMAIGTQGGKLELLSPSFEKLHTSLCHEDSVTSVKIEDRNLISASQDGVVKIHEICFEVGEEEKCSLRSLFVSENLISPCGDQVFLGRIRSMAVRGNFIYVGDDGSNIKVINWKYGSGLKLRNHLYEFGQTDSVICLENDLLLATGFDLDASEGYINVFKCFTGDDFSHTSHPYIGTLRFRNCCRFLCMIAEKSSNVLINRLLVAGKTPYFIEKIISSRPSSNYESVVQILKDHRMAASSADTDVESNDDSASDSELFASRLARRNDRLAEENALQSSNYWCSIS